MRIKVTEKEVAAWISQEINRILNGGGFPFQESTVETNLMGKKSRFPDIVIWHSRETENAFIFIELKRPGGTEDLDIVCEKAKRLRVKYCLTWNFTEGILYEISNSSAMNIKTYPTYIMNTLEKWKRGDIQTRLKKTISLFLEDFKDLYEKGHLHDFIPDQVFFVSLFCESVDKLSPLFAKHLKEKTKNKQFREGIEAWATKQGIANVGDEEFYEILSRQWVYSLMTRILFYLTLKRYYKLPALFTEESIPETFGNKLSSAFKAAKNIDWYAVFEENPIEEIGFPSGATEIIQNLLRELKYYHFGHLKEDVIGEIFEELIPEEVRHDLGQYFTREDLVDFIIGFVANNDKYVFCDPTCGSGTFLNRLYSRINWLSGNKITHQDLLSKLWGIDIANFPTTLATINLFRQKITEYNNFPHIIAKDFFNIQPGDRFLFPPPKISKEGPTKIEKTIPLFNGLVGNFPYIRQELIEKKNKGHKITLTKVLARDWLFEFPDVFELRINKNQIKTIKKLSVEKQTKQIEELVDKGYIKLKLSGKADIYAYLFFHSAKFLTNEGRMGIITSNSWLDVAYGTELKKFFLDKFKIVAIVSTWVEPWFEDASVNTVFTILDKCTNKSERMNHNVKFVKLKKSLKDLIPYEDLKMEESQRWLKIDALIREINYADNDFKVLRGTKCINTLKGIQSVENDHFRIRMVKQSDLIKELEEKEELAKWGKYLRAPDIYFEIIEKAKNKLVPLQNIAVDVRRGYTTGINDFFYLRPIETIKAKQGYINVENVRGWKGDIEKEFLKPVVKSPKEMKGIALNIDKIKYCIFICGWSKKDLKKAGRKGALSYIKWGEKQRTRKGVLWPTVESVKRRKYWWHLAERKPADFCWFSGFGSRFFTPETKNLLLDKRFYEIHFNKKEIPIGLCLLNSIITWIQTEANGHINLGDGALNVDVYETKQLLIPDPKLISKQNLQKILNIFCKLKSRPIKTIFEEVKMKDRQILDSAILKLLGLNSEEYLPKIYKGITEIVRERLELPKMRKKVKKQKTKRSVEQIKKIVEKDIIAGGIRRFPEGFVDIKEKKKILEIPVSGKPLKIGHYFMGTYEVIDEDGDKMRIANDIYEAKFLVYSYKPEQYIIQLPKNTVVIQNAVKAYEQYVKNLHDKLLNRAFEATHDHTRAERIANEILEEYGIKR